MLLLLFLLLVEANKLQCPHPEDRANAWYSGKTCDSFCSSWGCCFNELIDGNTTSCCYAYGTDGPIKCCGSDVSRDWNTYFFILLFLIVCCLFGSMIFCIENKKIKRD